MGGFLVGSLALIALYALVQNKAASNVQAGTTAFTSIVKRALSPDVAGIPLTSKSGPQPNPNKPAASAPASPGLHVITV